MNKTILIIGAGKSGRGFLPQYIHSEDHILFLDQDTKLIEKMAQTGQYDIHFYGEQKKPLTISNYEAYPMRQDHLQACLKRCDMIAISIGIEQYDTCAQMLLPYRHLCHDKVIVTFENSLHAAKTLQDLLQEDALMITEGSIFCTTNTYHEIDIQSQELCYLPIKDHFLSKVYLTHITPIKDFYGFMERKLYTYNLLSALLAFPGYVKGYEWLHEAAMDPNIDRDAQALMHGLNPILATYFHVSLSEQQAFAQQAFHKFSDPYIKDSIQRNCRNVIRKLKPQERFMKPYHMLVNENQDVTLLLKAMACACFYDENEESGTGIDLIKTLDLTKDDADKLTAMFKTLSQ